MVQRAEGAARFELLYKLVPDTALSSSMPTSAPRLPNHVSRIPICQPLSIFRARLKSSKLSSTEKCSGDSQTSVWRAVEFAKNIWF